MKELFAKFFSGLGKYVDEAQMGKDTIYFLWVNYYKVAAQKAAADTENFEWDDRAVLAADYLIEKFLKPKNA